MLYINNIDISICMHTNSSIYGFLFNPRSYKIATGVFLTIHKNNDVSYCPIGMASSQKIDDLSACLTKEQNLNLTCKFTPKQGGMPVCVFTMDKKVVATSNVTGTVDPTYKNRASVTMKDNVCTLILTGFSADQPETYVCTINQDSTNATQSKAVEKSKNYIYICFVEK